MSETLDRVLGAIDSGLQSSPDHGYGTDHRPDACARCQHHVPVEGGDLCAGCRAFLLGDVDEDPQQVRVPTFQEWADGPLPVRPNHTRNMYVRIQVDTDALVASLNRLATSMPTPEQWQAMAERVQEAFGISAADMMASAARLGPILGHHGTEPILDECNTIADAPEHPRGRSLHCPRHGLQPPGGHCRVCVRQANRRRPT